MRWSLSHRFSRRALPLADRHYSRQKPGSPQFVPPGRCLVLVTPERDALWVTSWPFAQYVRHEWPGAWVCSFFRNESASRASGLIEQATAATLWTWPEVPAVPSIIGPVCFITFINQTKVRPVMVRGKAVYGFCYRKAGWREIGFAKDGKLALGLTPDRLPLAAPPIGAQPALFR